jgi:hypothetical protein
MKDNLAICESSLKPICELFLIGTSSPVKKNLGRFLARAFDSILPSSSITNDPVVQIDIFLVFLTRSTWGRDRHRGVSALQALHYLRAPKHLYHASSRVQGSPTLRRGDLCLVVSVLIIARPVVLSLSEPDRDKKCAYRALPRSPTNLPKLFGVFSGAMVLWPIRVTSSRPTFHPLGWILI